jgi:hypothetical protein
MSPVSTVGTVLYPTWEGEYSTYGLNKSESRLMQYQDT